MICAPSLSTGRLNAFQRVMRQWSELHPYNATHTYKIAGPLRLPELREAIAHTYAQHGLGVVELLPDGLGYRHEYDRAPEVETLPAAEDPQRQLQAHVARELNRPFARPRCKPIRFGAIACGAAHYLTVTYDHWVADSVAARLIMRRVLGRYCGLKLPANELPLELYPATYRTLFTPQLQRMHLGATAARSVWQWWRQRSAPQVAYASTANFAVNYELHHTLPGVVAQLRDFAHGLGATVHDVILAALARAMHEFLPRRATRKGRALLLGTIVNTRGDAGADLSETLGTFLAYYAVQAACDRQTSLADVTRRLAAATRPIKERRSYLHSLLHMRLANLVWPHLGQRAQPHFMRRALPLAAGVTNVCLRNTWLDREGAEQILEYSRGASTGPSLPLALSPTTLGDDMNLGVSYRVAGFSTQKIQGIMQMLLDQLHHPWGAAIHCPALPQPPARELAAA